MSKVRRLLGDFRVPRRVLDAPNDDQLAWAVIEGIFDALRTPYEPDRRLATLNPGQRAVYALDWVRKEALNGGFGQLFWNSTGYLVPDAMEGTVTIGAVEHGAVLHHAAMFFDGAVVPRDRAVRIQRLGSVEEALDGKFDTVDDEFFALERTPGHDLGAVMARYIRANPTEFVR